MIKLYRILTCMLLFVLFGCGGSSSSSSKNLFSVWTSTEDGTTLSLEGFGFGDEVPYNLFFNDGSVCECNLVIFGEQSSGTFSLNSCFYRYGSSLQNPGCNQLNQAGSYIKTDNQLTLTSSYGSEIYTKIENPLIGKDLFTKIYD